MYKLTWTVTHLQKTGEKTAWYFLEGVASDGGRVWWASERARPYLPLTCLALEAGL